MGKGKGLTVSATRFINKNLASIAQNKMKKAFSSNEKQILASVEQYWGRRRFLRRGRRTLLYFERRKNG